MELTKERLEEMAAVDIRTVDISTLTDLRDIEIGYIPACGEEAGCVCKADEQCLCQSDR